MSSARAAGLYPMAISPDLDERRVAADVSAARQHDAAAFERLLAPHRAQLQAHCYRMLGSLADAEDALQETLVRAWRGLPAFEERASLRSWLYRIATNVCLRALERRPRRLVPLDAAPPADPHGAFAAPLAESVWLEPYPDAELPDGRATPDARYEQRESVELAFAAALQHLPARQRAVLLLRDVLGFAPREIATVLETTPTSIHSMLQRAHRTVDQRLPARSQQSTLRALGDERLRVLVERYVRAWDDGDVNAIVDMLTADATLTMPPRPSWYRGRDAVGAFLAARPLSRERRWQHVPLRAAGQVGFAVWMAEPSQSAPQALALELLTIDGDGRIAAIDSFHDPSLFSRVAG
ncbi:MAG TPA: RNA polymerase subunit sigma-70 [Conexibacter sp.]|jgi:RNA polymerase sigma-70 factor (ECF subfamily)